MSSPPSPRPGRADPRRAARRRSTGWAPTASSRAAQLIRTGRTYDLDCGRWPSMPQWDGHAPFQVLTYRTPRGVRVQKDWDWLGVNTVNFGIHSELLSGSAHTGTHIDALCHATCGADDHWFGGSTPERAPRGLRPPHPRRGGDPSDLHPRGAARRRRRPSAWMRCRRAPRSGRARSNGRSAPRAARSARAMSP